MPLNVRVPFTLDLILLFNCVYIAGRVLEHFFTLLDYLLLIMDPYIPNTLLPLSLVGDYTTP